MVVAATLLVSLGMTVGCSNVPKEVVELSYVIGEDLQAVHESHRKLVTLHYDGLRAQRTRYFEAVWKPRFIQRWVSNGRLVDIASGRMIFDEQRDDFVAPTKGKEGEQLVKSVWLWADAAIEEIEEKKTELMAPLDRDEKSLLASIDEAFGRLFKGNATITAHLNSLRQVQEVQDDVLKALNLKDLREKINKELADASSRAQKAQVELEKLDQQVQKVKTKVQDAAEQLRKQ